MTKTPVTEDDLGLRFRDDEAVPSATGRVREFPHPVWLHPDVSDDVRQWPHLYRRLGLVLRQLAAHRRTGIVKGCQNANQGWLRSPLGGHGGFQYYLWWTYQGSRCASKLTLPEGGIAVRAVRHHDDHRTLDAGDDDSYLPLTTAEDLTEGVAGTPWTDVQTKFVTDRAPVRTLMGRPGSGKTTALWHAVEARVNERVLYLTWSTSLTRHAEEHFRAFAPTDVSVDAMDFGTFIGEVIDRDVERISMERSRRLLNQAVTRMGRTTAGQWSQRLNALHAELRAVFVGQAVPGTPGTVERGGLPQLSEDGYRLRRGGANLERRKAVRALLQVARTLPEETLPTVFPELAAAADAFRCLRDRRIPNRFAGVDLVVVDEAQDLTLLELLSIVMLCREVDRKRGHAPRLLVAGDAGQTVRATGFRWGDLSTLLTEGLRPPKAFRLDEHVRCPKRIAGVVDASASLYTTINKDLRPGKQHKQTGSEHVEAHVIETVVDGPEEAARLIARLAAAAHVAMITPRAEPPAWVPQEHRSGVLTAATAKGLEYQTVCVLDGASAVSELRERTAAASDLDLIDQEAARTAIDELRVAISRATETLVFVEYQPSDNAKLAAQVLLGHPVAYSADDLIEHIALHDSPTDESVLRRTRDADALVDTAPARAWQRACQALELLGDPERPNGVADRALRKTVRLTVLRTAARIFVNQDVAELEHVRPDEVANVMREAIGLDALGEPSSYKDPKDRERAEHNWQRRHIESAVLKDLIRWRTTEAEPHIELLEQIAILREQVDPKDDWTTAAVPLIAHNLRNGLAKGAESARHAGAYRVQNIKRWLTVTGSKGDTEARTTELARKAVDYLLAMASSAEENDEQRKRLREAMVVLQSLGGEPLREGRLHETSGDLDRAMRAYREAGSKGDMMRVRRRRAQWEEAVIEAEGQEKADLEWLLGLERYVEARPTGQNDRLHTAERERIARTLEKIAYEAVRG